MTERPLRVMWLLNHTTARQFEVPMLKRIGVREVFLPKRIPADPAFRSASIDWSEDQHLSIPADDLAILNAADWYDDPGREAWEIANKHFDIAFFILLKTAFFRSMTRHFGGAKIWRTYGLLGYSYNEVMGWLTHREAPIWSRAAGANIWFGQAYAHLADQEPPYLKRRAIFLPAGLADTEVKNSWRGSDKRIFFVCPDLGFSDYYQKVYRDFQKTFAGLPYVIGGAQPVTVQDSRVLGYQPKDIHQRNMQELRVMYYHGTEPNHVHYHPFEAIRAGMPLVFMAGGLLDKLGGLDLPGRCATQKDARNKVERILYEDTQLINSIRDSQKKLLDPLKAESCEDAWRIGLQKVLEKLRVSHPSGENARVAKKRIAIIVPVESHESIFNRAVQVTRALEEGIRRSGQDVEIVFGYNDKAGLLLNKEFAGLSEEVSRRPFRWRIMPYEEASRASAYAGNETPLTNQVYQSPDDSINQFMDCDLWVVLSDRLEFPLLPVKPYLLFIDDYIERYHEFSGREAHQDFVSRAHAAEAVFVTSEFAREDARQFAGVPERKIRKLPMIAPSSYAPRDFSDRKEAGRQYFLWVVKGALHKNHDAALRALRLYYEEYDGGFECHVTGIDRSDILGDTAMRFHKFEDVVRGAPLLKKNLKIEESLSEHGSRRRLQGAAFFWCPTMIDNDPFSVVHAAQLGVPTLSSDYPAMREVDRLFSLNLSWMDSENPDEMARQLARMEQDSGRLRSFLPQLDQFMDQSAEGVSEIYWNAIKGFL